MDEDLQLLEREFCPPFDQPLVHAFWSDYKGSENALQQVRRILDGFKQSALTEQATDFDPSGSSGGAIQGSSSKFSSTETDSNTYSEEWVSQTTEDSWESGCFKASEHLDTPSKEALLAETFPTLRPDFVARILKKCDGNLSKATDELLNHVYLTDETTGREEELVVPKGIDGFSEEYSLGQRGKKSKGKRKQNRASSYASVSATAPDSNLPSLPDNKWQNGTQAVEFIAARTNQPKSAITSIYHKNGASLTATIWALIDMDLAANKSAKEPNATVTQHALDLVTQFPSIDLESAVALVRLTNSSTSNAAELAKALRTTPSTSTPTSTKARVRANVIPSYTPVQLPDSTADEVKLPLLPSSPHPQTSASLSAARATAFNQASAAYRKGRSDPLMKAAAGYYAQVGRDLNANLKAMSEADADALIASQSTPTVLDLHGVSVSNATRIALSKTQAWWDSLGEASIPGGGRSGVGEGFRIITGLGRHSEGGRGKLGPAVVKTLVKEGWKVEVGNGEVTVMGMTRRR